MHLVRAVRNTFAVLTALLCILLLMLLSSVEFVPNSHHRGDLFVRMNVRRRGDDAPPPVPWPTASVKIHSTFPDPSLSYAITNMTFSPGLGNLMFQYASLLGASIATNRTLVLSEDTFLRRGFKLPSAVFVTKSLANDAIRTWTSRKFPSCCRYTENVTDFLAESRENRTALGYFQSFRYFDQYQALITKEFQFLDEIKAKARSKIHDAQAAFEPGSVLVGIHVRHGSDLVLNSRNKYHGHTTANIAYYRKAMDYFRQKYKKVGFFVLGDDPLYAQRWLSYNDTQVFWPSDRELDMCMLSICDHVIMSTGTFGWWAGYLAGGDVIYFRNWPLQNSKLDSMVKKGDFFPPHWIPMTG